MGTGEIMRRLIAPVYLPTLLSAAGMTAIMPVIPLIALRLGFSVSAAAALTMISGFIGVVGPIPIGSLMVRWGERATMVTTGLGLMLTNGVGWWLVSGAASLSPGQARAGFVGVLLMMGLTSQVWMLGRQSYLGSAVPPAHRARAMSTFGGMMRIGGVIGPAAGAVVMAGDHLARVYLLDIGLMGVATGLVAFAMAPGEGRARAARGQAPVVLDRREPSPYAPGRPALATMLLTSLGIVPLTIARMARPVILPLLGAGLGLPATTIATIFAVAAVVDIAMFAPAGWLMDRRGRAAVAVPCLLVMGAGYVLLAALAPLAQRLSPTGVAVGLGLLAVLIALGNGFGAGIVMTIGLDLSPEHGRTGHLARWNTLLGVGRLGAPALVSAVTLVAPVAAAGMVVGVLCLAGGAWLARWLPQVTPGGASAHEA